MRVLLAPLVLEVITCESRLLSAPNFILDCKTVERGGPRKCRSSQKWAKNQQFSVELFLLLFAEISQPEIGLALIFATSSLFLPLGLSAGSLAV